MRRFAALSGLVAGVALPAPALAQDPVTGEPLAAQMTVTAQPASGGARGATLARDRLRIRGVVDVYVPGEQVTVHFRRGGRGVAAKLVTLQPGPDGTARFELSYRPPRPGTVSIRVEHAATAALAAFSAASRSVVVLPRRVGRRSSRASVRALQTRLRALGYVVGRRGRFDARTARAVLAFRKVTGMRRTTAASSSVLRRLARGAGRFRVRHPGHGRHVEADLSRQVLALIDRGRAIRIYPTSSGAPGTPTVRGSFRVYSKTPGVNAKGMLHSSYFIRGYAIHGYPSVPIYNASHGCLRVPNAEALSIFRWVRYGTPVDVYG